MPRAMSKARLPKRNRTTANTGAETAATNVSEPPRKQPKLDSTFELPSYLQPNAATLPLIMKSSGVSIKDRLAANAKASKQFASKHDWNTSDQTCRGSEKSFFRSEDDLQREFIRDIVRTNKDDEVWMQLFREGKTQLRNKKYFREASLELKKDLLRRLDIDIKARMVADGFVAPNPPGFDLKDEGFTFVVTTMRHNLRDVLGSLEHFDARVIAAASQRRNRVILKADPWSAPDIKDAARIPRVKPDLAFLKEKTSDACEFLLRAAMDAEITRDILAVDQGQQSTHTKPETSARTATQISHTIGVGGEDTTTTNSLNSGGLENGSTPDAGGEYATEKSSDPSISAPKAKTRLFMLSVPPRNIPVPKELRNVDRDLAFAANMLVVQKHVTMNPRPAGLTEKKVLRNAARVIEQAAYASAKGKQEYLDMLKQAGEMLGAEPGLMNVKNFVKRHPEGQVFCTKKLRNMLMGR